MQWLALFLSTISRYFVCLSADAQTPFTHTLLPKKYHWRRRKKLWKSTTSRIYSVWKLLETQTDKLIILHIFESSFMHWQRPTTECCCCIPLSLSRLLTTVQHPRRLAPAALLLTNVHKVPLEEQRELFAKVSHMMVFVVEDNSDDRQHEEDNKSTWARPRTGRTW